MYLNTNPTAAELVSNWLGTSLMLSKDPIILYRETFHDRSTANGDKCCSLHYERIYGYYASFRLSYFRLFIQNVKNLKLLAISFFKHTTRNILFLRNYIMLRRSDAAQYRSGLGMSKKPRHDRLGECIICNLRRYIISPRSMWVRTYKYSSVAFWCCSLLI